MKTLEIRRHSIRQKPGQNLTQRGVTLARQIGENMGKFVRVITSPVPRAFQTALAMGYAVDATEELLATYGEAVEMECPYPASFADYAAAYRLGGAAFSYARRLAAFYATLIESLPEGGAALAIHHGGIVELSAIACLPNYDYTTLGGYIECCEGIRLTWEDGKFTSLQVLRI